MRSSVRRCVVLFARAPRVEATRKGLRSAEILFDAIAQRLRRSVCRVAGVDLLCCGVDAPDERSIPQHGASFAERLANAFADARALGYEQVVVVPGDVPGLDHRAIGRAFASLRRAPVVLGPSPDGGVYLLGCRGPADVVLAGVRWCTSHVTRDLLKRAPDAARLDAHADVDHARDLSRLRRDASVPAELRALVALAHVHAPGLAFEAGAIHGREAADPEPPRGPPLLR